MGITLFILLHIVSNSFKYQVEHIVETGRVDLVVQSRGAVTPMASRISSEWVQYLDNLDGIDKTIPVVLGRLKVPWNPYFIVMGISSPEVFTHHIRLVKGALFQPAKNEIVIGRDVAAAGYDVSHQIMLFENERFKITGIYSSEIQLLNSSAVLDLEDAKRLMRRDEAVNLVFIRLQPGYDQDTVATAINTRLPDLNATPTGALAGQILLVRVIDFAALLISVLAIAASCIIITNTLLMSITERIKEIGVLMAIGWSKRMICKLILTESLVICLAGMLAGNLASYVILGVINYTHPEVMGWWIRAAFDPALFMKSVVISLLLGGVSAFYPAYIAARLNPVQALRYE